MAASNVTHRNAPPPQPDWRITCYCTDAKHRRQGVGRAAHEGSLDLIARAGGGLVEALPEATAGRVAHGRFLFEMSVELHEDDGFQRVRQIGKDRRIVNCTIDETEPRLRAKLDLDQPALADGEPPVR